MKRLVVAMALLAYMSCMYGEVKNVIIGGNDHTYEISDAMIGISMAYENNTDAHASMVFIASNLVEEKSKYMRLSLKYTEWKETAKANNIKNHRKCMDNIAIPKCIVGWQWYDTTNISGVVGTKITPWFVVENGEYSIEYEMGEVVSVTNQFIKHTPGVIMVMKDQSDFDKIIDILSLDKVNDVREKMEQTDGLFK